MKTNPAEIFKEFKISFGTERRTQATKYRPDYVEYVKEIETIFNNFK